MHYYDDIKKALVDIHDDLSVDVPSNKSKYSSQIHKYELTQKEVTTIFHREIYQEIIKSTAFQRLKKIHFLGSIDYTIDKSGPKPNKRHTRYQHSLGVAQLALQYSLEKNLSEKDEVMCVVSALLHDIGHAPLSHSLESVFKKEYGISHHVSGERIIKGEVEIGKSLHNILNKWDINPFEIMAIISGVGKSPYKEIFSYSINIDTIEAILRSSTYLYKRQIFFTPSIILSAFLGKEPNSTLILDKFWHLKGEVYSELINSQRGVVADYLCQKYMIDNIGTFEDSYYYGTEAQLKEEHKKLFDLLEKITKVPESELLPDVEQIPCIKRSFFIDDTVEIVSPSSLNHRYKQEKLKHIYKIKNKRDSGEHGKQSHRKNFLLF